MIVTTIPLVEGQKITRSPGVVSSEAAPGVDADHGKVNDMRVVAATGHAVSISLEGSVG